MAGCFVLIPTSQVMGKDRYPWCQRTGWAPLRARPPSASVGFGEIEAVGYVKGRGKPFRYVGTRETATGQKALYTYSSRSRKE